MKHETLHISETNCNYINYIYIVEDLLRRAD